jgi:hypothetical protein
MDHLISHSPELETILFLRPGIPTPFLETLSVLGLSHLFRLTRFCVLSTHTVFPFNIHVIANVAVNPILGEHAGRLALEQIYGYMVRNACPLGILSTFKGWCFLRRYDHGILRMIRMYGFRCHPRNLRRCGSRGLPPSGQFQHNESSLRYFGFGGKYAQGH